MKTLKSCVQITFLLFVTLNASTSEDKLEVAIIGKIAKYITWEKPTKDNFIITVLHNPFGDLFDKQYSEKKINSKNVKIVYINKTEQLTSTDILYISSSEASHLDAILKAVKDKNILTVSNIRGFAEKKGILQLYFINQKIKLKINLDVAKEENLKIRSTLLRIAKVIKEDD